MQTLRQGAALSYVELLEHLRQRLASAGFSQVPQLASSLVLDLKEPFSMDTVVPASASAGRSRDLGGADMEGQEGGGMFSGFLSGAANAFMAEEAGEEMEQLMDEAGSEREMSPTIRALLQVRGLTSKTLESSWHRVLAMENSFRIYKMNGDIIEIQTATCIVRDIKEALERSSGISASDVGLLVDGCELRNNASVSPGVRDLFLVVHNSLRAIAQDFVINTQCAYGSYGSCGTACHSGPQERLATDQEVAQMSHLANSRMLGLEEAGEVREAERKIHEAKRKVLEAERNRRKVSEEKKKTTWLLWNLRKSTQEEEKKVQEAKKEVQEAERQLQEAKRKAQDRAEVPGLLGRVQDAMPDYVQRCVAASVALEAEDERRKKNQDVYDRDILDLAEGELPLRVMLDYKDRSWGSGFQEDAIAAARLREGRVEDLIESAMLREWQSGCEVSLGARRFAEQRGYADADAGFGWRQAIQVTGKSAPLPRERVAILDLTCAWGEGEDAREAACRVVAKQLAQPEAQWVLVIEAMMSSRPQREALCAALMSSGVAAVGFVRSVAAAVAARQTKTAPDLVAVEVSGGLVLTPVYEGFMICDAIIEGSKDLPGLAQAHGQAIAACPVDTRLALRRNLLLYGAGAQDFEGGLEELKRATGCSTVRVEPSLAPGADKLLSTCDLEQLFVTREKYASEGMAAVHRTCL
ncbi:unnamed protein product [Effrenium voratum]|nr:unnamed protein product [Effrenium voratum]